ncbi:hypothetical protein [Trinickia symbiotica]|uniref:hypothetical protein n=1 Tax=Trinickia symbiotica TaxID=863227 RepID=UPI00036FB623|nr:hypothetical protein [Trinickia symbiotica]
MRTLRVDESPVQLQGQDVIIRPEPWLNVARAATRRLAALARIRYSFLMRFEIAALGLLLLLIPFAARAADVEIVSGSYDGGMLIGFDRTTGVVTGYFSEQTGEGQFSCIFYLTGKLRGSEAPISTYFSEAPTEDLIKGQLVLGARGEFQVRLPSEHGGCWNVEHFADESQPADFTLDAAYPWITVAVVKRDKAYFFDTPASAVHRKGYVVKGDGVGVRATQPGWLQVDFVGNGKPVSGWIRQSDVYPTR